MHLLGENSQIVSLRTFDECEVFLLNILKTIYTIYVLNLSFNINSKLKQKKKENGSDLQVHIKHSEIAKRCPEYISSVVEVSHCYYQKTVLSFFSSEFELSELEFMSFVTILVFFKFYHNSSFLVLLLFKFLSCVPI